MPQVTGAEAIRKLRRDGWFLDRIQGSHHMLQHPVKTGTISVPVHPGRDLAPGTLRKIIRDAGLTPAAFFRLEEATNGTLHRSALSRT